jgi:hypothetical protein
MVSITKFSFSVPRCSGIASLLACCAVFAFPALAQTAAETAAETAAATSVSAGTAASAKVMQPFKTIPIQTKSSPSAPASSPHIVGSTKVTSVEANRHALEAQAGTDAARLLVRATPSQAQVWINNQPVGNTPLLLILAPGKYTLEMRGSRQETARQELALLPKETREVAVKLEVRYPTRVVASH